MLENTNLEFQLSEMLPSAEKNSMLLILWPVLQKKKNYYALNFVNKKCVAICFLFYYVSAYITSSFLSLEPQSLK